MIKKPISKRYLSVILSLLLIFTFVDNGSHAVFAQENDTSTTTDVSGETVDNTEEITDTEQDDVQSTDDVSDNEEAQDEIAPEDLQMKTLEYFSPEDCCVDGTYFVDNEDQAEIIENMYAGSGVAPQIAIEATDLDMENFVQSTYINSDTSTKYNSNYWYSNLTSAKKTAYSQLATNAYEFDNSSNTATVYKTNYYMAFSVTFTGTAANLSGDDCADVYFKFRQDNPQIFWADTTIYYGTGYLGVLVNSSYKDGSTRLQKRQALYNVVEAWKNEVDGDTDYYKEYLIHNKICDNNVYTSGAANAHDAVGTLIDGQSVCEGISKAMQIEMNAIGIDCILVTGYMTSAGSTNGAHAWNQVGLKNSSGVTEWYNVDVTWADQSWGIYYGYFNVTDSFFYSSDGNHTAEDSPVYTCTSTTFSYDNHDVNSQSTKSNYTITYEQPQSGTVSVKKGTIDISSGQEYIDGSVITINYTSPDDTLAPTIKIYDDDDTLLYSESGTIGGTLSVDYTLTSDINISFSLDKYVASIGSNYYTSLADAFNAATSNSTIMLLSDVDYDGETMPKYAVTIQSYEETCTFTFNSNMALNNNLTFSNVDIAVNNASYIDISKYTLTASTGVYNLPTIMSSTQSGKVSVATNETINIDKLSNVGTLYVSGSSTLVIDNANVVTISVYTLSLANTSVLETKTLFINKMSSMSSTSKIKLADNSALYVFGTISGYVYLEANNFSATTSNAILGLANVSYTDKIILTVNDEDYVLSKTDNTTSNPDDSSTVAYEYTAVPESNAVTLSYSTVTKELGSINDAVDYMNRLNSSSYAYKIVIPDTLAVDNYVAISTLPDKASSITFETNNLTLDFENISVTYALIFNSSNIDLSNCVLGNVTTDSDIYVSGGDTNSIKTLTLESAGLNINAPLSVTTLVTTSTDDENYSSITIYNTDNEFTLNAVTLSDKKTIKLIVNCDLGNKTELIKSVGSTVLATCFAFEKSNTDDVELSLVKEGTSIKASVPSVTVEKLTDDGVTYEKIDDYVLLQDAVTAINTIKDTTAEYRINVYDDSEIISLPTKCKDIIITGNCAISIPSSLSQSVPVTLQNITVNCSSENTTPTWKTSGKDLTLDGVTFNGNITGSTTGTLNITFSDIFGSISTFKNVNLIGENSFYENITAITNLKFNDCYTLNIYSGKTMSVTNIELNGGTHLIYNLDNDTDSLPNVTASGYVTGDKMIIYLRVNNSNTNFDSGTKLLTASKATADCFEIDGDNLTTYKNSTGIYAGEKTFALYCGEDKIADYAVWSDVLAYINNQTTAQDYTVELSSDYDLNGAFTTPATTKCTSLTIKSDDTLRTFKATSMTLTTTVDFDNINLVGEDTKGNETALAISLSTNGNISVSNMTLSNIASIKKSGTTTASVELNNSTIIVNGVITVSKLSMVDSSLTDNSTFTVDELSYDNCKIYLNANSVIKYLNTGTSNLSAIYFSFGKSLTINSIEDDTLGVKIYIVDTDGNMLTPETDSIVITTTDVRSDQISVFDENGNRIETYRSGNYIKVAEDTPLLSLIDGSGKSLGTFNSLKDMNTEIARRNDKTANYKVTINKNIDMTTAFPFPAAGKYNQITYSPYSSSYDIEVTCGSDIVLTGNTVFNDMKIKKVSKTSDEALPINVSLGAYSLTLYGVVTDAKIEKLTNITGSTASELHIRANDVEVLGNITGLGTLSFDGVDSNVIKVYGNISVANINIEKNANEYLKYLPTKTISISNVITTNGAPLILCPLEYNNDSNDYEDISAEQYSTIKVITSAPNITTTSIQMYNDTDLVFYKDSSAVKLGEPVIEVVGSDNNTYKFARFNDAMDFANADDMDDHTITLVDDVASAGALTMPAEGKTVTVTKADSDDEVRTLNFTGSVVLSASNSVLTFKNITLNNSSTSGVTTTVSKADSSVEYDNCDVKLYTMTGAGTILLYNKDYTVNGAISGTLTLDLYNTNTLFKNNVTVKNFIDSSTGNIETIITKLNGKSFTISGDVSISTEKPVTFNVVDADGTTLSVLKSGTTLLTATNATAAQFTTDNTMAAGSDIKWLITKSGTAIKTAGVAAFAYSGDRQTDVDHQFASFNEAKEYITGKEGKWTIELTGSSTGAILTDLPESLESIVCTGDSTVTLTTTSDINLSADLTISNVMITATSKTVNANNYKITLSNSAKLTAGKALKLNTLTITGSSVVTFTSESEINSISLSSGNIKCSSIVSYEI